MSRLVFLLEEYSMKILLDVLLPRIFPELKFLCVSHQGKQDLERSIPRKLKAWREPGARFVIIRDQDAGDCVSVKKKLREVCVAAERPDTLIRIACRELEAWYLGDPDALADAFNDEQLRNLGKKAAFRNPDNVQNAADELERLVPEFQKVSGARAMGPLLDPKRSNSRSFRVLIEGIQRICEELKPSTQE